MGHHRSASVSRLLGLDGFQVLAEQVVGGGWQLEVQTTATVIGCAGCGMRAELHGRRTVRVRDLPIGRVGKDPHAVRRSPATWGSAGRPSCGQSTSTARRWWRTPCAWTG